MQIHIEFSADYGVYELNFNSALCPFSCFYSMHHYSNLNCSIAHRIHIFFETDNQQQRSKVMQRGKNEWTNCTLNKTEICFHLHLIFMHFAFGTIKRTNLLKINFILLFHCSFVFICIENGWWSTGDRFFRFFMTKNQ